MAFLNTFRRRDEADRVSFDDIRVVRTRADGATESLKWDDLGEVGILTTDQGPSGEDVIFVLLSLDGKRGCAIPQAAEGSDKLLARLQLLPGFDNAKVAAAMASAGNARFTCWKRPA